MHSCHNAQVFLCVSQQFSSWEQCLPLSDIWQCLEMFLIVTTEGEVRYSRLVGRGQGCCSTCYSARDSPPQPTATPPAMPVLTKPGVTEDKAPSPLSSVLELGCSLEVLEEVNPTLSNTHDVHVGSSTYLKLKEPPQLLDLLNQFLLSTL